MSLASSHLAMVFWSLAVTAPDPTGVSAPSGSTRDSFALAAIGDRPEGPAGEAIDAVQAVRAALRQRGGDVLGGEEARARLGAGATTMSEVERAYAGAQAAYQADETDSALRILETLIEDIGRLPATDATRDLWVRAHLRVAQAQRARDQSRAARDAMRCVLVLEPAFVVDSAQFSPAFRRDFEEERRALAGTPRSVLRIEADRDVRVRVDGKEIGTTPVTVALPRGRYRVAGTLAVSGGAAEGAQVPPRVVEMTDEDAVLRLDTVLAGAVRPDAGPGMAIAPEERGAAVVAYGERLQVDRIVALELVRADERRSIEASLYDVRRGALLREAQVPVIGGRVVPDSADALASFLMTGDRSSASLDLSRSAGGPPGRSPPRWLRPAAYGAGLAALGAGAFALMQARSASDGYASAGAMVRSDGALVAGTDRARYDSVVTGADSAKRNAYVGAAGAAVLAVAAGVLGYLSLEARGPAIVPAIRF